MDCEIHNNFGDLSAAARSALSRLRQKSLFDRYEWYQMLHNLCLPDQAPLIVEAGDDRYRGWLFLHRTGWGQYGSLANWYSFAHRPVFAGVYDEVAQLAILGAMAQRLRSVAHHITLAPMPDENDSAQFTARAFRQAGWKVRITPCDDNHILRLNGRSFDCYWDERPGQLRNTVKRKARKNAVQIRIDTAFHPESWADYTAVYARSWKPEEGNPDFLEALARREAAAGCLRLGLAYIDGRPAAAQFWTVEHGTALIHKLAHDEAAREASPGSLLSAALFQHVIDVDRVELIDFGTGNDGYKRDWMEENRPRYRLDLYRPESPLNWPALAKNSLRTLVRPSGKA